MESPFPKSASTPGGGRILTKLLPDGRTVLETASFQYPLKLISPSRSPDQRSALVFLLSYGGGLVGGDAINLDVQVRPNSRLTIVTQGHTKIFNSPRPDVVTRQTITVDIAEGAALCLLPDPVQPFEASIYEQRQIFRLHGSGASLCLLDWVTQGRTARGEDWSLTSWVGRNEVWAVPGLDGSSGASASARPRLLVRDAVILDDRHSEIQQKSLRDSMHKFAVFGTLILRGPLVRALGRFFLAEFAALPRLGARDFRSAQAKARDEKERTPEQVWRTGRLEQERQDGILWSAASVRGCVVVKFGSATVEGGRVWIGSMLAREGSVSEAFGDHALMCVR